MGAPKGNKNHLMHGLYCTDFTPAETEAVKKLSHDLSHEIFVMQAFGLRIIHQLAGKIDYDKEDHRLIRLLAYICQTVGTLTTRRAYLNGEIDGADTIMDAIVERNAAQWAKA